MTKIKIVSCKEKNRWYCNEIGNVYEVSRELISTGSQFESIPSYMVKDENGKEFGIVYKDDAEVIEDDQKQN